MILLLWLLFTYTFAQEKKDVRFEAGKVFYHKKEDVTSLKEDVHIETGEWQIRADEAEIWGQEHFYLLYGSCSLKHKKKAFLLQGNYLEYDDQQKKGFALSGKGEYDPFFFQASKVEWSADKVRLKKAALTTCPGDVPNYTIKAKDITYFPGRRVVGHHMEFYARKTKLFAFPWYYQDLRGKQPFMPDIGRDNVNGFFLKFVVPYALGKTLPGLFLFDYTQKKGTGVGLEQNYDFWEDARAKASFKRFQNSQRTGTSLESNLKIENPFKQGLFQAEFSRLNTINTNLSELLTDRGSIQYQYKLGQRVAQWNLRFNRTGTLNKATTLRLMGLEQLPLGENMLLELRTDALRFTQRGVAPDLEANPSLKLLSKTRRWSWSLIAARRFDLDRQNFQGDQNFPFFDLLPELTLSPPVSHKYLPTTSFVLGHYREGPQRVNASRFEMQMRKDLNLSLGKQLSLATTTQYQQSFYDEGSAKFQLSITPTLKYKPAPPVTLSTQYRFRKSKGHTPFIRDRSGAFIQRVLFYEAAYGRGSLTLKMSTSRDLVAHRWSLLLMESHLRSARAGSFLLRGEYNLDRGEPGTLFFEYKRENKDFQAQLSLRYDMNERKLLNIQEISLFPIGRWYAFESDVRYLPQMRQFVTKDFKLTRDLNCMEASVRYRAVRKELAFQIFIKAFPSQRLGIGVDERGTSLQDLPF